MLRTSYLRSFCIIFFVFLSFFHSPGYDVYVDELYHNVDESILKGNHLCTRFPLCKFVIIYAK